MKKEIDIDQLMDENMSIAVMPDRINTSTHPRRLDVAESDGGWVREGVQ